MNPEEDSIKELESLLKELDSLAPKRESDLPVSTIFRKVEDGGTFDDAIPEEELFEESIQPENPPDLGATPFSTFEVSTGGPVAAVDCGIIRLGETENGLVIALRASIVIDSGENTRVKIFKTGPIYLHNQYKLKILHEMGKHLGKESLFVELNEQDPTNPIPEKIKSGVADDAHQFGDRFRNWLERLVQRIAVTSVENGTILFDGALTLRTRDTHASYLENLARLASNKGNSIIAISKQSQLQIQSMPIRFWLKDHSEKIGYRNLSSAMLRTGAERVLGNAYAARLSVLGPTFRMDVKPVAGQTDKEAIDTFYSSVLMRGGYPDILVRAHAHSYFTSPDVVQLQAHARAKYSLIPEGDVELTSIFAPFGGRFK